MPSYLYTKKKEFLSAKAAVVLLITRLLPEQNTKPKTVAKAYSSQKATMMNMQDNICATMCRVVGTVRPYSLKSANAYSVKVGMLIKKP